MPHGGGDARPEAGDSCPHPDIFSKAQPGSDGTPFRRHRYPTEPTPLDSNQAIPRREQSINAAKIGLLLWCGPTANTY